MVEQSLEVRLKCALEVFNLRVEFKVALGLIVLFGPSGAGKSTVLDCLSGLRVADEGLIKLGGMTIFDSAERISLSPQERRFGCVFQRPALFPHLSVRDNIGFGIEDWAPEKRQARIKDLSELLKLERLLDRRPAGLSGGESQRVALARAIAPEPRMLLLDEPFTALDMKLRGELGAELRSLQRRLVLPMVLVTHSREDALELADTVVCMLEGRIESVGSPRQLLANE